MASNQIQSNMVVPGHQYSWEELNNMSNREIVVAVRTIPMTPVNQMMWLLSACSLWRLYAAHRTLEEVWNAPEYGFSGRDWIFYELGVEKVGVDLHIFSRMTFAEALPVLHKALNKYYHRNVKGKSTEWVSVLTDTEALLCELMIERGIDPPNWSYDLNEDITHHVDADEEEEVMGNNNDNDEDEDEVEDIYPDADDDDEPYLEEPDEDKE